MKILEQDLKKGFIKLRVESLDDLYWLSSILEPGDLVTMRTTRRVKQEGIRADSGERVPMTITLEVEKVKMDQYSARLRITGIVRVGPEKFGIQGQHHTLNVTEGSTLKVVKEKWSRSHLDILRRAEESSSKGNVILVAIDDEGATVAKVNAYRAEEIAYVRSNL
ncbi:MAG: mRNA surveillance protein Pelota, partial [Candidatus Korarchaeota archaeon]|nr:mRNA surveillance protein Pelota [Candidatus Korarchaeota archaeon]